MNYVFMNYFCNLKKTFKKLNEWLIISILHPNVHSWSTDPVSALIPGADWEKSYLRVRHFYHRRYAVCVWVFVCVCVKTGKLLMLNFVIYSYINTPFYISYSWMIKYFIKEYLPLWRSNIDFMCLNLVQEISNIIWIEA